MENKLTWILITANILVFLLVFSLQAAGQEEAFKWIFDIFSFSWATKFEVWRWLTSLFLHVSASHLFFNMLGLYFFGKILEGEVKKQWFIAIYFVSGLLGNFVFMFSNLSPIVGASGAMFGVMGAAMLLNPIKKIHFYVFPLPLGLVAVMFVIVETLVVYFQADFGNIAHIAHVGGVITGGLFAFFYNPKRAVKGVFVLGIIVALLLFLGPVFALIAGIGGIILGVIDMIVGFFLYGAANIISVIWM